MSNNAYLIVGILGILSGIVASAAMRCSRVSVTGALTVVFIILFGTGSFIAYRNTTNNGAFLRVIFMSLIVGSIVGTIVTTIVTRRKKR